MAKLQACPNVHLNKYLTEHILWSRHWQRGGGTVVMGPIVARSTDLLQRLGVEGIEQKSPGHLSSRVNKHEAGRR